MEFSRQRRTWSMSISLLTLLFLVIVVMIPLIPMVKDKKKVNTTEDVAAFQDITEDVVLEETPVFEFEEELPTSTEDAYDYSTDVSENFSNDFVLEDIVDTSALKYTLDVTWSTLVSKETVIALYDNVSKDESHDEEVYTRCTSNIKQALTKAQDHMSTVEGKTSKIAYTYTTDPNSMELLITLQVFDDAGELCYEATNALGIISNEGDV